MIAPLTIASAAPSTWEGPDPSEVPLPRTMLLDILERGELLQFTTLLPADILRIRPVCGFHKPGYLRKGRSEVLILEEMD